MRRLLALVCLLLALAAPASAETRVALVVANGAYAEEPLQNPRVDAGLIETSLKQVGFDVKVVRDADLETFDAELNAFADRAKGADLALFYYAGHGFAVNAGVKPVNMLMATDAKLTAKSEFVLAKGGVPVDAIVERLRDRAKATLLFIDACRNDPRLRATGGAGRGLAPLERFSGGSLYIAVSTQLGDTAADGDAGQGSPFARAFAAVAPTQGLRIDDAFRLIRDRVQTETGGRQVPDVVKDELPNGSIVFAPGEARPAGEEGALLQQKAFDEAMAADTVEALEAFLGKYPDGALARVARRERERIGKLAAMPSPSPTVVAMVPKPVAAPCGGVANVSLTSRAPAPLTANEACALKRGDGFRECADCPAMVVIPPGTFTMGSPDSEQGRFNDEGPRHIVKIARAFAVGEFPVTRAEFAAFVKATGYDAGKEGFSCDGKIWSKTAGRSWRDPGFAQTETHPVVCVNWNDAQAYVQWLSKTTGQPYRLLSESEWEYAARGRTEPGAYPRYFFGDSERDFCQYGKGADQTTKAKVPGASSWTVLPCQSGFAYTSPVGSFKPNAFGLFDMLGDAWQWVEDCYHDSYEGVPRDGSAVTSGDCGSRALRGGSWYFSPRLLRAAVRIKFDPSGRNFDLGLRVARMLPL